MCVYKPWSASDQRAHETALEKGSISKRREVHGASQRFRQVTPAASEVRLSDKDQALVQSMLTENVPGSAFAESPEDNAPVSPIESPPAAPADSPPVSPPVNDFDLEIQVDDEIEVEPVSSERDEDEPMLDAPWPSLHDAEAIHYEPERSAEPQPPSPPVTQRKRKVNRALEDSEPAPAYKKKKTSTSQTIDVDECFAGLETVRTLKKKAQDWFDEGELEISVPYSVRYYLMPQDGTPVVSSAAPENLGRKSKRPPGTLFEDGSIVNPSGKVEAAEKRRANHACEMCRLT